MATRSKKASKRKAEAPPAGGGSSKDGDKKQKLEDEEEEDKQPPVFAPAVRHSLVRGNKPKLVLVHKLQWQFKPFAIDTEQRAGAAERVYHSAWFDIDGLFNVRIKMSFAAGTWSHAREYSKVSLEFEGNVGKSRYRYLSYFNTTSSELSHMIMSSEASWFKCNEPTHHDEMYSGYNHWQAKLMFLNVYLEVKVNNTDEELVVRRLRRRSCIDIVEQLNTARQHGDWRVETKDGWEPFHSIMVQARCPALAAVMKNGEEEKTRVVKWLDYDNVPVTAFLDCIYTDVVGTDHKLVTPAHVAQFLDLAERFMLPSAKKEALFMLKRLPSINVAFMPDVIDICKKFALPEVLKDMTTAYTEIAKAMAVSR